MAKKTKKEKILAELRRLKVIAKQQDFLIKGATYTLEKPKESTPQLQESNTKRVEVAKEESLGFKSIPQLELSLILKDLRKIVFLTALFLGLQIILYLTLLRNL